MFKYAFYGAIGITALGLALSACVESPEERNARQDALCQSFGAKRGTDQYIQCRATIHTSEVAKKRADDNAAAASAAYTAGIVGMAASGSRR